MSEDDETSRDLRGADLLRAIGQIEAGISIILPRLSKELYKCLCSDDQSEPRNAAQNAHEVHDLGIIDLTLSDDSPPSSPYNINSEGDQNVEDNTTQLLSPIKTSLKDVAFQTPGLTKSFDTATSTIPSDELPQSPLSNQFTEDFVNVPTPLFQSQDSDTEDREPPIMNPQNDLTQRLKNVCNNLENVPDSISSVSEVDEHYPPKQIIRKSNYSPDASLEKKMAEKVERVKKKLEKQQRHLKVLSLEEIPKIPTLRGRPRKISQVHEVQVTGKSSKGTTLAHKTSAISLKQKVKNKFLSVAQVGQLGHRSTYSHQNHSTSAIAPGGHHTNSKETGKCSTKVQQPSLPCLSSYPVRTMQQCLRTSVSPVYKSAVIPSCVETTTLVNATETLHLDSESSKKHSENSSPSAPSTSPSATNLGSLGIEESVIKNASMNSSQSAVVAEIKETSLMTASTNPSLSSSTEAVESVIKNASMISSQSAVVAEIKETSLMTASTNLSSSSTEAVESVIKNASMISSQSAVVAEIKETSMMTASTNPSSSTEAVVATATTSLTTTSTNPLSTEAAVATTTTATMSSVEVLSDSQVKKSYEALQSNSGNSKSHSVNSLTAEYFASVPAINSVTSKNKETLAKDVTSANLLTVPAASSSPLPNAKTVSTSNFMSCTVQVSPPAGTPLPGSDKLHLFKLNNEKQSSPQSTPTLPLIKEEKLDITENTDSIAVNSITNEQSSETEFRNTIKQLNYSDLTVSCMNPESSMKKKEPYTPVVRKQIILPYELGNAVVSWDDAVVSGTSPQVTANSLSSQILDPIKLPVIRVKDYNTMKKDIITEPSIRSSWHKPYDLNQDHLDTSNILQVPSGSTNLMSSIQKTQSNTARPHSEQTREIIQDSVNLLQQTKRVVHNSAQAAQTIHVESKAPSQFHAASNLGEVGYDLLISGLRNLLIEFLSKYALYEKTYSATALNSREKAIVDKRKLLMEAFDCLMKFWEPAQLVSKVETVVHQALKKVVHKFTDPNKILQILKSLPSQNMQAAFHSSKTDWETCMRGVIEFCIKRRVQTVKPAMSNTTKSTAITADPSVSDTSLKNSQDITPVLKHMLKTSVPLNQKVTTLLGKRMRKSSHSEISNMPVSSKLPPSYSDAEHYPRPQAHHLNPRPPVSIPQSPIEELQVAVERHTNLTSGKQQASWNQQSPSQQIIGNPPAIRTTSSMQQAVSPVSMCEIPVAPVQSYPHISTDSSRLQNHQQYSGFMQPNPSFSYPQIYQPDITCGGYPQKYVPPVNSVHMNVVGYSQNGVPSPNHPQMHASRYSQKCVPSSKYPLRNVTQNQVQNLNGYNYCCQPPGPYLGPQCCNPFENVHQALAIPNTPCIQSTTTNINVNVNNLPNDHSSIGIRNIAGICHKTTHFSVQNKHAIQPNQININNQTDAVANSWEILQEPTVTQSSAKKTEDNFPFAEIPVQNTFVPEKTKNMCAHMYPEQQPLSVNLINSSSVSPDSNETRCPSVATTGTPLLQKPISVPLVQSSSKTPDISNTSSPDISIDCSSKESNQKKTGPDSLQDMQSTSNVQPIFELCENLLTEFIEHAWSEYRPY